MIKWIKLMLSNTSSVLEVCSCSDAILSLARMLHIYIHSETDRGKRDIGWWINIHYWIYWFIIRYFWLSVVLKFVFWKELKFVLLDYVFTTYWYFKRKIFLLKKLSLISSQYLLSSWDYEAASFNNTCLIVTIEVLLISLYY